MSGPPEMSKATREILAKVRKMVPPLLDKFHKGRGSTIDLGSRQVLMLGEAKWVEWLSLEVVKITPEPPIFPQWQVRDLGQIWYAHLQSNPLQCYSNLQVNIESCNLRATSFASNKSLLSEHHGSPNNEAIRQL